MPQPLSAEEERERRKKRPSPIPPLPEAVAGQTAGQLAGVQRRMAALPVGSAEYQALARQAEELELLQAAAVPSLRQQAGQLRTLAMRPLETPEAVEKYPGFLQPVGRAFRELTSPAQIALMAATAGLGPPAAAVIRGGTGVLGVARGLAAGAAAPVLAKAPFAPRLAAEAGINLAAILGAQEAARRIPETAPWPVRVGLPLAAGLAGAGGVLAAGRVLPPLARAVGREIITTPAVRERALKAAMPLRIAGGPLPPDIKPYEIENFIRTELKITNRLGGKLRLLQRANPEAPLRLVGKDRFGRSVAVEGDARFIWNELGKASKAVPEAQVVPPAPVAAAKEPWQMTVNEYKQTVVPTLKGKELLGAAFAQDGLGRPAAHRFSIVKALSEGKAVPPEVLAEYPDLAARAVPGAAKPPPTGWPEFYDEMLKQAEANQVRKDAEWAEAAARGRKAAKPPSPIAAKPPSPIAAKAAEVTPPRAAEPPLSLRNRPVGDQVSIGTRGGTLNRSPLLKEEGMDEVWVLRVPGQRSLQINLIPVEEGARINVEAFRMPGGRGAGGLGALPDISAVTPMLGENLTQRELRDIGRVIADWYPDAEILQGVRVTAEHPQVIGRMDLSRLRAPRAAEPLPPAVAEAAQAPVGPTRAELPPSAAAPPPVKPPTEPPVRGGPPEPPEDALKRLATYIHSPESLKLSDLTIQMRKAEAGQRITRFASRVEELLAQGKKTQEAIDQATKETMGGKFERPISALTESMAKEFEEAGFARIHAVLKDEPWEEISTAGALRNALEGKGIPRIVGVEGGSAYTRLSRVFPPEVMEVLGKGKPLAQVFEDARLSGPGREWQPHEIPGPTWERAEQGLFPGVFPSKGSLGRLSQEEVRQRWLASFPEGQPYEIPGQPWERAEQLGLAPKPPPMEPRPRLTPQEMERQKQLLEGYLVGQMPTPRGVPEPLILPTLEKETRQALIPLVPSSHREVILRVAKEAGLNVMDVLNFMRANKSSFDLSFWRQMAMLAPANKRAFWRANLRGLKAAKSAEFAKAFDDSIRADLRYYTWYERLGLDFLRPLEQKGLPAYKRTEEFLIMGGERPLQKLAGKLPHLRISQRAFVTSTNSMTWDIFKGYVDDMLAQNAKIAAGKKVLKPGEVFDVEGNIKALGTMLEDMSGRAQLGKPLQGLSGPLNAGLFAVRFSLGRFLTPRHLLSANPMVRREAWKNVLAFVGTITAVEMLGEGLGLWSVGKDPRSSTFRKIRIGNTWYDPWGGFLQYAVLTARLLSRQRVDEQTGRRTRANPQDTIAWFIRGKGAPGASLLADFSTGTTFLGEKTDIRDLRQWVNRIAPMALEDFYDVAEEEGAWGIAMGIPGIVGIGMATYGLRQNWSKELAPYYDIPSNEEERKAKRAASKTPEERLRYGLSRGDYRQRNPEVDAKLFIAGDVESLQTMTARYQVVQLMRQLKVRPQDIDGLQEKEYESNKRKALRLWILRALGQSPRPPLPGTRGVSPPVPSWDYQYR